MPSSARQCAEMEEDEEVENPENNDAVTLNAMAALHAHDAHFPALIVTSMYIQVSLQPVLPPLVLVRDTNTLVG